LQDEEISRPSPPKGASLSPPSVTPSHLTAANVRDLQGSDSASTSLAAARIGTSERRDKNEINRLRTEVDQLEQQKQRIVEENRDLKMREDKAVSEKMAMVSRLELRETGMLNVRT